MAVGVPSAYGGGSSGPSVSVNVSESSGEFVAHLSSTNWPSCAKSATVSLTRDMAKGRHVQMSNGAFDLDVSVADGDVVSVSSVCKSGLHDWATQIHTT